MITEEQQPGWVFKSNSFPPTTGTTGSMTVFSPIEVENTMAEAICDVSEDGQTVDDNVSKEGNEESQQETLPISRQETLPISSGLLSSESTITPLSSRNLFNLCKGPKGSHDDQDNI